MSNAYGLGDHMIEVAERLAENGYVSVRTGTDDPRAPRADVDALRDELTADGGRWQITQFWRVRHGFTDPSPEDREGVAYDLVADRVSWSGTLALTEALLRHG